MKNEDNELDKDWYMKGVEPITTPSGKRVEFREFDDSHFDKRSELGKLILNICHKIDGNRVIHQWQYHDYKYPLDFTDTLFIINHAWNLWTNSKNCKLKATLDLHVMAAIDEKKRAINKSFTDE